MGTLRAPRLSSNAKLVLIEPRTLFRESFVRCLAAETEFSVEGIPDIEKLRDIAETCTIGLIVLSLSKGAPYELVRLHFKKIDEIGLGVPTVVLSGGESAQNVIDAFDAGAEGYITTSMTFEVAVAAMRFVAAGGNFAPAISLMPAAQQRSLPMREAKEKSQAMFTARQVAVIEALRKGMANKTIAYELNLCESTVKVHVRKIMRKLNATNRTQAAFLADELKNRTLA